MGQDFIGASYIYLRFNNRIFSHLPKSKESLAQTMFIKDYNN